MNTVRAEPMFPPDAVTEIRIGLFDPTLGYQGGEWDRHVLAPWIAANPAILSALRQVGDATMATVALDHQDRYALYALSRVLELLILPHQPPATRVGEPADWLPRSAYHRFGTAIGATFTDPDRFHPFLHEIVEAEPADDPRQEPVLIGQWWPGCLVGSLLLVRGGASVMAGTDHLDPVLATTSTLYWAWRRRYRDVADLSHGWGSNSQWGTEFRRDYALPDRFVYHADAMLAGAPPWADPPPPEIEVDLVRHLCSTRVDHGSDQWVWHSHHTELIVPGAAARCP
ncbi:hypothetical protein [Micromonospora sp. RP3T]|uniref:hypothetical protein n=1 Tax=Micromonospora sp. RP3T TaxID=2135446 RepID=UPI000D164EF7|nr:hypothetical protein [Micromonospora sp. RP3T]PTA47857.1 hypothetical protein C8054_03145 [Micromonospora sp. RP3T]